MKVKPLWVLAALFAVIWTSGCYSGIDCVEFSPDNKLVAYEETTVWCPLYPIPLWEGFHFVRWRPVEGKDADGGRVPTGKTGNLLPPARDQSGAVFTFSPDGRHLAIERMDGVIMIVELASKKIWNLDTPPMEYMTLVWASNREILYSELELIDTRLETIGTWRQDIHQPAASRVASTMPETTSRPAAQQEILSQLRANSHYDSFWGTRPDFFLSSDGQYVAKVEKPFASGIDVFPTPPFATEDTPAE